MKAVVLFFFTFVHKMKNVLQIACEYKLRDNFSNSQEVTATHNLQVSLEVYKHA